MKTQNAIIEKQVEIWKKKLFDISNKNQAINFRRRLTSTLQIISPNIFDFLDLNDAAKTLMIAELFNYDEITDIEEGSNESKILNVHGLEVENKSLYELNELKPLITTYTKKYKGSFVYTNANPINQRKALRSLLKRSKAFKEENAVSVLYFAVGYLKWYENKSTDLFHLAPLFFISATIGQPRIDAAFKVTIDDGDIILNEALLQRMKIDFNLDFSFDISLDTSSKELYIKYCESIKNKFRDKRWEIIDEIDLAIFRFSNINMANDLIENILKIKSNLFIQKITASNISKEEFEVIQEEDIDKLIDPSKYFHALSSDSSQEVAIQVAVKGQSFVLQGPPGTGKSQTITNIITELIASGKKVLFVAEKKAALDVVYNNLKKIGLNDFALPIHDTELNKKQVIQELMMNLEKGTQKVVLNNQLLQENVDNYLETKKQLIDYDRNLLEILKPLNTNLYYLYGQAVLYESAPTLIFSIDEPQKKTMQYINKVSGLLDIYEENQKELEDTPQKNAWVGFKETSLSLQKEEEFYFLLVGALEDIKVIKELTSYLPSVKLFETNYINEVSFYINLYNFQVINNIDLKKTLKNKDFLELTSHIIEFDHEKYELLVEEIKLYKTKISASITELTLLNKGLLDKVIKITKYFKKDVFDFQNKSLEQLLLKIQDIIKYFQTIKSIVKCNALVEELSEYKLQDFLEKIKKQGIFNCYKAVFLKRFYTLLIDEFQASNLMKVSKIESIRDTFIRSLQIIQKVAPSKVESLITSRIPNYASIQGFNKEVSILRVEGNKSRKLKPFRVLFSEIPNLITKLKPCLMMSPLSVASFLRKSDLEFDTVIFDEASQVRPENAIGAIFRAKQVIIAGDKEQLPPTTFFQSSIQEIDEGSGEEQGDIADFDSILDVADSYLNSIKLRWHYRSKVEELIIPSNDEIYKNLVTFPAAFMPSINDGIKLVYTKGIFKERKNLAEADELILKLKELIDIYGLSKSIGVVTFNEEQQNLIESKVLKLRKENPKYEEFFSNDVTEPFFIKNIETVQGDERDIILISLGYAPNEKGILSMNFGPLNKEGGYRRFNVAVTRAKQLLIFFSSIKSSEIDLNRSNKRGVKFLKNYLSFAQQKQDNLSPFMDVSTEDNDNFKMIINDLLVKKGYQVIKDLGSNEYKLDLCIVDPINSDKYLLGIELNGSPYLKAASVRDKEYLREAVLSLRGWNILRLYPASWLDAPKDAFEKILNTIKKNAHGVNFEQYLEEKSIEVSYINKDEELVSFNSYPNYDLIQPKKGKYSEFERISIITKLVMQTAPISRDILAKLCLGLWEFDKINRDFDVLFPRMLQYLVRHGYIFLQDNHIFAVNKEVAFRETSFTSTKRNIEDIADEELKSAIMQVLGVVSEMEVKQLKMFLSKKCGFSNTNSLLGERLSVCIEVLQVEGKVFLNQDVLKMNI